MEPNNIKKLRDKLNSREIAPSDDSWNRLEGMLDQSTEKKSPANKAWLFIAAAIAAGILLSGLFFGNHQQNEQQFEVVASPVETDSQQKEPHLPIVATKILVNESVVENVSAPSNPNPPSKKMITGEELPKSNLNVQTPEPIIIIELPPSDEIVETLLAQTHRSAEGRTIKVNAANLLHQVDGEVELTFREKVIKSASKNFQSIKVAVANRNIE